MTKVSSTSWPRKVGFSLSPPQWVTDLALMAWRLMAGWCVPPETLSLSGPRVVWCRNEPTPPADPFEYRRHPVSHCQSCTRPWHEAGQPWCPDVEIHGFPIPG